MLVGWSTTPSSQTVPRFKWLSPWGHRDDSWSARLSSKAHDESRGAPRPSDRLWEGMLEVRVIEESIGSETLVERRSRRESYTNKRTEIGWHLKRMVRLVSSMLLGRWYGPLVTRSLANLVVVLIAWLALRVLRVTHKVRDKIVASDATEMALWMVRTTTLFQEMCCYLARKWGIDGCTSSGPSKNGRSAIGRTVYTVGHSCGYDTLHNGIYPWEE